MTEQATTSADLCSELAALLGSAHVLTGEADRRFFSQDIAGSKAVAGLVAAPGTVEELAGTVAAATAAGQAVVARGGGASYTSGFVPERAESVILDTRRLDRIVDIDTRSMHVTVEAGCTWQRLTDALAEHDLRTPYWGPLSGAVATIGGSLSQNSILWGSARYGMSAEDVIGLDVVLADGSLLVTGAGAARNGIPFLRNFGPDLTGLFLGDCGALGVKARATLKLIRRPAAVATGSFGFDTPAALAGAMTDVAREGLASDCFGLDPVLQKQRLKRAKVAQGVKALAGVVAQGGLLAGLKDAAKVALAGRDFLDDSGYSMHVCSEAREPAAANAAMDEVRRIAATHGGREVPDSVPKLMRGARYVSMASGIGPDGERWLPVHALLPLADADDAWQAVLSLFARHDDGFRRHGIEVGVLTAVVGGTAFALEPVFYWPAPRTPYYQRVLDSGTLAGFKDFPPNPEGEALVFAVRDQLAELFMRRGAAHLQIGRTYRYREGTSPVAFELLRAIKRAVDPRGLMNPGVLGLE